MPLRQKHFINSHKGATPLFVLALIATYGRWENQAAWAYLATHGSYGLLWVLKSRIFPDRSWEKPTSIAGGLGIWGALSMYWIGPWLIVWRNLYVPAWYVGMCVAIYVFGVFLHFSSDMQKHTALSLRPGLITTGMFASCRNPNYFGELLIYLGFSMLAMHWVPIGILSLFVLGAWVPLMRKKDKSLSRYPEFAAYKQQSALFIPFLL
jgi:protein-S-isoprenylcysteine O-methyltransferase Ste14